MRTRSNITWRNVLIAMLWTTVAARTANGQGLWEPPNIGDGRAFPVVAIPSELIPTVTIGPIQIILDKTPLPEIAERFKAQVGHRGDASESLDWICVTGRDAGGRWVLFLESGEIHGESVGAFQMRRIATTQRVDPRCRQSSATVQNPARLLLGMPRDDVRRILGAFAGTPTAISYVHEHSGANDFTVENIISVTFRQGIVAAFEVWKTETN